MGSLCLSQLVPLDLISSKKLPFFLVLFTLLAASTSEELPDGGAPETSSEPEDDVTDDDVWLEDLDSFWDGVEEFLSIHHGAIYYHCCIVRYVFIDCQSFLTKSSI